MERVLLVGVEDVQRAANNIRGAAEQMSSAARQIYEAQETQHRFLNEWLDRFEAILKEPR
jgi:hypothetical protein